MAMYKVIQWGAGFTGITALRYISSIQKLHLVAARCFTSEKEGQDVGALLGGVETGVRFTRDTEEILQTEADCVVFMPRDLIDDPSLPDSTSKGWVDDLDAILRSGKNVVSPICTATHWAHLKHGEAFRARLNAACSAGGSSVLFSGFDPGFTTDALAYTLSGVVGEISQIRTWEIIDVSGFTGVDMLRQLGLGAKPEALPSDGSNALLNGWGGALHLLGDAFGVEITDKRLSFDIFLAPEPYVTAGGLGVEAGTIAAVRWSLTGFVEGAPRFVINHITRAGKDVAGHWPTVGTDGGYRLEIDANPPLRCDMPMGLPGGTGFSFSDAFAMTAARCVNLIDTVVEAPPGYHTFLSLPALGGRLSFAAR